MKNHFTLQILVAVVASAGLHQTALAADYRFSIDEETVLDEKTGLRWQRCSVGMRWQPDNKCHGKARKMNFKQAQKFNDWNGKNALWRVPTKTELETLIDKSQAKFNTNTDVFPDVNEKNAQFWSSDMFIEYQAWYAEFNNGYVSYISGDHSNSLDKYNVRLVHVEK